MPTVQIEAEVSTENLVAALRKLPQAELDGILRKVRHSPPVNGSHSLTPAETELLDRINAAISPDDRRDYESLRGKLEAASLTESEHPRLTALTDRMEDLQADRVRAFADMAALRGISFRDLWLQLGLSPEPHA